MGNYYQQLTEFEKMIVRECLKNSQIELFFPDWEFGTLFGFSKVKLQQVYDQVIKNETLENSDFHIVTSLIGQLLGYPHGMDDFWHEYFSVSQENLLALLKSINELRLD